MKSHGFIIALLLSQCLYAETTVKNSAPFSFPTTVGVMTAGSLVSASEATFTGRTHFSRANAIDFSWSLTSTAKKGSIAIFTVSGACVTTIPIASQSGSSAVDISGGKLAHGIYFAKLAYGSFERTVNFIVYR
jgi:hypothetical protein